MRCEAGERLTSGHLLLCIQARTLLSVMKVQGLTQNKIVLFVRHAYQFGLLLLITLDCRKVCDDKTFMSPLTQ